MDYLKEFLNLEEYETYKDGEDFVLPNVSLVNNPYSVKYTPYTPPNYFRITNLENVDGGSTGINFDAVRSSSYPQDESYPITLEYCVNGDGVWTSITDEEHIEIPLPANGYVELRGDNESMCNYRDDDDTYLYWNLSVDFNHNLSGDIMSICGFRAQLEDYHFYRFFENNNTLIDASNLILSATVLGWYCYYAMFRGCTSLTTAPELPVTTLTGSCYDNMFSDCASLIKVPELPATTLAEHCYSHMFWGCTSLITAPVLPATTLAESCYSSMFSGCTNLNAAPKLLATTLISRCYSGMFYGCTSLTTAPELPATTLANGCYDSMFENCTSLTTAPELPATTLTNSCYSSMFQGCTNLTTAPELSATTLADYCYYYMFYSCTNLTTVPELPATTLADYCYGFMFYNCSNLTTAPNLPATELAAYCYNYMFSICTNLVNAPELPATTLTNNCYSNMFNGCIRLTTAPELPATTLVQGCYSYMFNRCLSLNYIKAMFTTTPSSTYTNDWVKNVASTGIFIKNSAATWTTTGANGVPTGWTATINYLRFTALEDGSTLQFKKWDDDSEQEITPTADIEYSLDGSNFITFNSELELSEGETVYLRGDNPDGLSTNNAWHYFVTSEGSFECHGNIMSLLYGPYFETSDNALVIPNDGCFSNLFYNASTDSGCNIITAPELPANTLTRYCYDSMFYACVNLTTVPELPATTLADYCYRHMFTNCRSLTTAPELPATTLADSCYRLMFVNCTSLTIAPELPATTLVNYCYQYMFNGCTNLNYIKAMFITTPGIGYTDSWVNGVASTGTFVKSPAATWDVTGSNGVPTGWNVEAMADEYFTTIAREDGTISFNILKSMDLQYIENIYYSIDNGETWNKTENIEEKTENLVITVNVNKDDKILWKGSASQFGDWYINDDEGIDDLVGSFFSSTCKFDVQGNIMSLLYGDNFEGQTTLSHLFTFAALFYDALGNTNCKIVNAKNLSLPATTLTAHCYHSMFLNCKNLITAPILSATTLAQECYECMFEGCTSLKTAPKLPATTLVHSCYSRMFYGCTSLTSAPELPAITLEDYCYRGMFSGCTSLNYIKAMFTTTPNILDTDLWVRGVAVNGTFVKNSAATWNVTGEYGIPTGWTVQTASE